MPEIRTYGITISRLECEAASSIMDACWVCDIEEDLPEELNALRFHVILFSHILEHLREPGQALRRVASLLHPAGRILIALPNIAFYKHRIQLALGRFDYQEYGVFDETHLRFFTYNTACSLISTLSDRLRLVRSSVSGNVPLGPTRHLLGKKLSQQIDSLGRRVGPNLFGSEILLEAVLSQGAFLSEPNAKASAGKRTART